MKDLAAAHPDLVQLINPGFPTGEGRAVEAIVVGDDPGAEDGRPVMLQMGLHHGREWPSGELAMEWAYELLDGAEAGDPRALAQLASARTIVMPVVNPDGFNLSREAGELRADWAVRTGRPGAKLPVQSAEYHRKNCRLPKHPAGTGDCGRVETRRGTAGVDVNRNYGGMWGGSGGGLSPFEDTYRGPGPFSEPEIANVREIYSTEQVTASSSLHNYARLILRPPPVGSQPPVFDEPLYKRIGARMARRSGYTSEPAHLLYDASGTLEGWAYYQTGSIEFTPELGGRDFHTAYEDGVIRQWNGTQPTGRADGGMREATWVLAKFARRPSRHVVVSGTAPAGGRILFRKRFKSKTLPVLHRFRKPTKPLKLREVLNTSVDVGADGTFTASLNPSTRPIVAQREHGVRREVWNVVCLDPDGKRIGTIGSLYAERGDEVQLNVTADSCG